MQNMSNGYNTQANSTSARYYALIKDGTTTLTIDVDNFKYQGLINSDEDIKIGCTCASSVSFTISNPSVSLEGKELAIKYGLMVDGVLESIRLGYFTIEKPTIDGEVTSYVGYDRMINAEKAYFSDLTYPNIAPNVINEIATKLGITFATTLPCAYTIATKPVGYTYREVIGYIAALYGANAIINRDGQLEFKWYTSVDYNIDGSKFYENGIKINSESNFALWKLTCTVKSESSTQTLTAGTGTQGISISNPFMTQEILNNVYTAIKGLTYRTMEVQFLGDFRPDLGDIVTVTQGSNTYTVPIMQITHECDGGVISKITSIGKSANEQNIDTSGPTTRAMERYYGELVIINQAMINKLDVEVAEITYATIQSLVVDEARISTLEVTTATIDLANIDVANIDVAKIGSLFAKVGLISTATISEGHITGYLETMLMDYLKMIIVKNLPDKIL